MEEDENGKPRRRRRPRSSSLVSGALLSIGAASLVLSVMYTSVILAFIGLGLAFWGALLLYIRPEEYTRKAVLDAVLLPPVETLNRILDELDYNGKAVYLPPEYLANPDESLAYISKHEDGGIPAPKLVLEHGDQLFLDNPKAILATPHGAELTKLFEKRLGTSFTKKTLKYVKEELPRLLVEDLQILEGLQILEDSTSSVIETGTKKGGTPTEETPSIPTSSGRNKRIQARITNSIFKDLCQEISSPISSAIACALAKVTGRPITIEEIQFSDDGETVQAIYSVHQPTEGRKALEPTEKAIETVAPRPNRLSRITVLLLAASGLTLVVLVGWITWYDMTVWGKDLYSVLFGSRAMELISLGIGVKVIYYLLIGLALLAVGSIIHIRSRQKE
jgi:hypothetical protein